MLKARKLLTFRTNFKDKCIVYKNTRNREYVTIGNTNLVINEMIDYGGSSKIFTTNKPIIIKMSFVIDAEIQTLEEATKYVLNDDTFHFIVFYGYSKCNKMLLDKGSSSSFSQKELTYVKEAISNFYDYFYLIFLEQFDSNIVNVLYNENPYREALYSDINKVKSIYAQMFLAVASFHYFINAVHDDVSLKNFFIKFIDDSDYQQGTFIHYKLYGEDVYVPYYGFIVVLADYGNVIYDKNNTRKIMADYDLLLDDNVFKRIFGINIDVSNFDSEKDLLLHLRDNVLNFSQNEVSHIINEKPYKIFSS